jgi:ParB-like chromosome segregation protein Spo0J
MGSPAAAALGSARPRPSDRFTDLEIIDAREGGKGGIVAKKTTGGTSVMKAPPAAQQAAPVLGADIKGELEDIQISRIIDPAGPSDRIELADDAVEIKQLAGSMREAGQLQPVMLEQLADGRYCRIFGRRRIQAAKELGWDRIRAVVVPPLRDDIRRTVVAVENVQRKNLTPVEETLGVDELMLLQGLAAARQLNLPLQQGCGALSGKIVTADMVSEEIPAHHRKGLNHDALLDPRVRRIATELVAAMLGKPAEWVRDRLYVGKLSAKAKQLIREGKLPLAHAREISKLGDEKRRDELARDYAAGGSDSISDLEAGPLEDLQEEVRKSVFALHVVDWKLEADGVGGRRPCVGCPHNSLTSPGLFENGGKVSLDMVAGRGTYDQSDAGAAKVQNDGICTLPTCYADKLRATKAAISACAKRAVDGDKPVSAAKPPAFVEVKAIEEKVKARRARAKSSSRPSKSSSSKPEREEISWEVRNAFHNALRHRMDELEKSICEQLRRSPKGLLLGALVRFVPAWQNATQYNEGQRKKAIKSVHTAQIVEWFKDPAKLDPMSLISSCDFKVNSVLLDMDEGEEMAAMIAQAMGLPVPPEPKLEDFMPKKAAPAEPATTPEKASKKTAKKPAKKAGRKAAAS